MATVPIEFVVQGRPSSVNGGSQKAKNWKKKVLDAGNAELVAKLVGAQLPMPPYREEVTAKVFFFPHNDHYTDIDNGLKHTIDALACHYRLIPPASIFSPILANDRTVVRLIVERFAPAPNASLVVPAGTAPLLARALMIANGQNSFAVTGKSEPEYATAIKFEPYVDNFAGLW